MAVRPFFLAVLLLAVTSADASAQRTKTRFDGIRDCERSGRMQFFRHNPNFRRFVIERAGIDVDRYGDRVGNQFVSTIYRGKATYEAAAGTQNVRFICLHAGAGRGAVFVYTLVD
jgi:hypothetical protein